MCVCLVRRAWMWPRAVVVSDMTWADRVGPLADWTAAAAAARFRSSSVGSVGHMKVYLSLRKSVGASWYVPPRATQPWSFVSHDVSQGWRAVRGLRCMSLYVRSICLHMSRSVGMRVCPGCVRVCRMSTRVPGPVAIVSLETRKVNAVRVPPQNGVGDHHQTIVCVYGPTAMSVPTVPPKRGRKGGNA